MTKVGEHITLDIIGTTKEYDPSLYEKVIKDIAKAAKVTILNISKYKSNILFETLMLFSMLAFLRALRYFFTSRNSDIVFF